MSMSNRPYDVVLFGATGFTGGLVAEYLARSAPAGLRWALAGRDRSKLEAVRDALKLPALPIIVADSNDQDAIDALARQTRVVCTTVGPYRRYGEKLVRSCAREGTHYCDITGEVPFVRASIDDNHAVAQQTGARIVHCCGFDSVPSDLGTFMLWDHARRTLGEDLAWVRAFVTLAGRGAPGGVESAIALIQDSRRDNSLRVLSANPYSLDPDPARREPASPDQLGTVFDSELGQWTAPFVMAMVNTRIVRRSSALLSYGKDFRYAESMSFGKGAAGFLKSSAVSLGLGIFIAMAFFPIMHSTLRRLVHADPKADNKKQGWFDLHLLAHTESGKLLSAHVAGKGDPGCEPTAIMLAESALALASTETASQPTGVLTPATAIGSHLVDRLRRAGLTFAIDASDRRLSVSHAV